MDALVPSAELDLPKALVAGEVERMVEGARADLKQRGIKDADKAPIPAEMFQPQAERRVRLGLVVAELVRANNLQAKPEQLKAHIEELAQSYEKPAEVVRWYLSDRQPHGRGRGDRDREQRHRLRARQGQGRPTRSLPFDELMAQLIAAAVRTAPAAGRRLVLAGARLAAP